MGKKATAILLTPEDRDYLETQTRSRTIQAQTVCRARILLLKSEGESIDAIADKVLVNSVLVVFASNGFIHPIIAVIYIFRDEIVNVLRMYAIKKGTVVAASMMGKIKTFCMMCGLSLMFFYNIPFEFLNIHLDKFLIYLATILSVVSGF